MQKSKTPSPKPLTPSPDYPSRPRISGLPDGLNGLRLQLGDYTSTFYGPSNCQGCGKSEVVRKAFEQGAESWETREAEPYVPHHCSHVLLFRKLTGRVLTVIDAAFPPTSPQLKAIKDLLKRDFADAVAEARVLEGKGSSPFEEKDPCGSTF